MNDHWLSPIRLIRRRNRAAFDRLPNERSRWDRLCELNVIEQTVSVSQNDSSGYVGARRADCCTWLGPGACAI